MSLTVYKSSAGSGKTFTLVKEYIKLVIDKPDNYKHILAITFTNKAANEMKSRILLYLAGLAGDEKSKVPDVLANEVMASLSIDKTTLKSRAAIALAKILHGYSNFAVSTIDSFVNKLVRNFARELKLPLNFDLELDEGKLIGKSIELLLNKVGTDASLTQTLVQFVAEKMQDEKSWDIERELRNFTKILLKESSVSVIDELKTLDAAAYIKISHQLASQIKTLETEMSKPGLEAMRQIEAHQLLAEAFAYGKSGIYSFFNRVAALDFSKAKANSNKNIDKMLETGKWISGKCEAPAAMAIERMQGNLEALYLQITANSEIKLPKFFLFKLIHQNIYPMAVLGEIEKVMEEFRENENIVHISEFNKRIAAIISSEPVPFIYERLGEKYHHFLLDEFQDTSVLQWQNLLPLIENSLAGNHFNMIVGDGKQAIYRWRSGEVEQFVALPKIYQRANDAVSAQREALLIKHFDEQLLGINYRSRQEIVNFNNHFFEFAAGHLSENLQSIYHQQKQEALADAFGGLVHLEFLKTRELDKEQALLMELERVKSLVQQLSSEYALNEITILTRKNDDANLVALHLIENNIPVVTSEALMLSSSPEVCFVISILKYLNDPTQKVVLAEILLFLSQKHRLKSEHLHQIFENCREMHPEKPECLSLEKILENDFSIQWKNLQAGNSNLYELVENINRLFDLNPKNSNPFLRFFSDTILEFNKLNDENLSNFLDYWDEKGRSQSIIIPESTQAVRVMTIHKAKGLQFPVVIYPFTDGMNKLGINEFWIQPEIDEIPEMKTALVKSTKMLDETKFARLRTEETAKSFLDLLNVLYVAMTRPSERIFVLLRDKHDDKGKWKLGNYFYDEADLFYHYLIQNELWKDDQPIYKFGHTGNRISKQTTRSKEADSPLQNVKTKKGKWHKLATIAYKREAGGAGKNRDYGLMVHQVLSKIRTSEDIPRAVNQIVVEGLLKADLKAQFAAEVGKIVASPKLKDIFDATKTIFSEKEILLSDGRILRPDRIVIDENCASIIDYKTGKANEDHKKQVNEYAAALQEMNYKNIEKNLVYLDFDKNEIERLSW